MHAEQAIERFGPLVMSLIWRINGNHDETADLYQEVFVKFHETTSQRGPLQQPKAWSSLLRIVVTLNDEPLSDSQQQAFDEFVDITETVDENGDQVVNLNVNATTPDQILQALGDGDGVLLVTVHGPESSEAVSSDSDPDSIVVNFDSLSAAKIGSQSPGVAEDRSWGNIKRAAGSTTDDSP